jgi:hypothetical protein
MKIENDECLSLCNKRISLEDINKFKWMIDHEYKINMVVDGLPSI